MKKIKQLYLKLYNFLQVAFIIFITLFAISTIFIEIDTPEFIGAMKGSAGIGFIFSFLYNMLE